jgi:cytochrome P450
VQDAKDNLPEKSYSRERNHNTLFDLLLQPSPENSYTVPPAGEMVDHAFLFLLAGIDTTSTVLTFATHFILSSPDVLERLQSELHGAKPFIEDNFDFKKVRRLPYLVSSTGPELLICPSRLRNSCSN